MYKRYNLTHEKVSLSGCSNKVRCNNNSKESLDMGKLLSSLKAMASYIQSKK